MTYEEFRDVFKKHHICGAEIIGFETTYDSMCPMCEPEGNWEQECRIFFDEGRTIRMPGYWYSKEQLERAGVKIDDERS